MRPRPLRLRVVLGTLAYVIAFAMPTAFCADEEVAAVDAIWKVRSVSFRYFSPTTYYVCDTLRQRVADIMLEVGASELMYVQPKCMGSGFINDTSIRLVVGIPIEATRENLVRETTFDSRTQLIAQARNWTLATPETVHRFRAVMTDVSFSRVQPSDCELLQAMSEQVFPRLGIQVNNKLQCSGSLPLGTLSVTTLKPIGVK